MRKKALITGITGQDGAYLAELLLEKGYTVYGTYRRTSSVNFWRIEELGIQNHPKLHLVEYDLTDLSSSVRLIKSTEVDEVYNLAAQSFVGVSFEQPVTTTEITGIGALNLHQGITVQNDFSVLTNKFGIVIGCIGLEGMQHRNAYIETQVRQWPAVPANPLSQIKSHERRLEILAGRHGCIVSISIILITPFHVCEIK